MKFKKQKTFSKEYDLKTGGQQAFILRITERRIDLEVPDKSWKIVFGHGTYEYAFMYHMLKSESLNELHMIAIALFGVRLAFRDPKMVQEVFRLMDESVERIRVAQAAPEQSDDIILAEEKVMHEQTSESVRELEELKLSQNEQTGTDTTD